MIMKKVFSLLLIPAILIATLGAPLISYAQTNAGENCGTWAIFCNIVKFFRWVSLQIGYLITYVAAALISLATSLMLLLIDLGTNLRDSPLVKLGFNISLNLANLGFVVAIIYIAFATMLRIAGRDTKLMLRNLIAAALLVNFSFVITGVFIDVSNTLGLFFLSKASPGGPGNIEAFANNLANALNIQSLANITVVKVEPGLLEVGTGFASMIASITLTAVFSIILVITFFSIALMLIIRYVQMSYLLILMPIAWLLWIFPETSGYFKRWWGDFMKWIYFLPAMSFFIYLSVFSAQKLGEIIKVGSSNQPLLAAQDLTNLTSGYIVSLLQILVMVGILIGGLMTANEFGIDGARGTLELANKVKNKAIGVAGKMARAPAQYFGTGAAKAGARGLSRLLTAPVIRMIPGIGTAANALAGLGARKGEVEEYQKTQYSNLSNDQIKDSLKALPLGPVARSALLAESSKRGLIDKETVTDVNLKALAKAAQATNPGVPPASIPAIKEIINVNPLLAPELTKTKERPDGVSVEEAVAKISAAKATDIDKDALKDPRVAKALNQQQLSNIIRNTTQQHIDNIKVALSNAAGPVLHDLSEELTKAQKELFETKRVGDKTSIEIAKAALRNREVAVRAEQSRPGADPDQIKAYKNLIAFKQIIGNPRT